MREYEKRELNFNKVPVETREDTATGAKFVRGKIPYNSFSADLGGFREVLKPGVFTKSLKEGSIPVLWNHETRYVCGRNTAGTAKFTDTDTGLEFEAELPNATWASDMWESIKRGDVRGVSFGFVVINETWKDQDKNIMTRELNEVQLYEVSAGVTFPAYPKSKCDARNKAEDTEKAYISKEEREQLLSELAEIKATLAELRNSGTDTACTVADGTEASQPEPVAEGTAEERNREDLETEERERQLAVLESL